MNLDRIGAAAASRTYQIRCKGVRMLLPEYIGSSSPLPESIATHLSSCLVCRVEADRLRQVAELLAEGRQSSWTPPSTLVDAVMARLDEKVESRIMGRLVVAGAVAVGLGVVVAVAATRRSSAALAAQFDS
ncbi:MAG: hypothetical protein OEY55_02890 [Acidimicrobiia bacterium]|nr:hypothetical protein [Acidimicrobiia bacterium]MDH5504147.1 hypothetical protein [Acidimicrobiia bacterium]